MAHKVRFPRRRRNRDRLVDDLSAQSLSLARAETAVIDTLERAEELAQLGFLVIDEVYSTRQENWIENWNAHPMLVRWFGEVSAPRHVWRVYRRMKSARDRLRKNITVRVRPERERSPTAQNAGWFAEPKTFKIFPAFLEHGLDKRAAITVHELIHLWFRDQRIDGEKVYGDALALRLAREEPRRARRSAENYEQFVFELATS